MAEIPRRSLLGVAGLVTVAGLTAACRPGSRVGGRSLLFDRHRYTERTAAIFTAKGSKEVTYRLYSKIPYVAKPVDVNYQSLTLAVPTRIDGKDVDAFNAPILLDIPVGGYLSARTTDDPFAGGEPDGTPPSDASGGGTSRDRNALPVVGGSGQNMSEAIAAGWVVVSVGARGRDNRDSAGNYYGKAPAAIVDLKAAVRYLRSNSGRIPGNVDRIVSVGTGAGGALSVLLGASGGSYGYYTEYLTELGAANAVDTIFAAAAYCPITDLGHADGAYEFLYGSLRVDGKTVDQRLSKDIGSRFPGYQNAMNLTGLDGRPLTADRYRDYLLTTYLQPAATAYLTALPDAERSRYLSANTWITWSDRRAAFSFAGFLTHLGSRAKPVPAFDAFERSTAENAEFGNRTINARHFTEYTQEHDGTFNVGAKVASDIYVQLQLMNPMFFIAQQNRHRARHWFLRVGTSDTDTPPTVLSNLAAGFHGLDDAVDSLMYWDAGHGANNDPGKFIAWANTITAHTG